MLIGLAGAKQSGKTTAARYLAARFGFVEDSFAAPLRRFACDLLGVDLDGLERIKVEPQVVLGGKTPRELMQLMGTEFVRDMIHPDTWVRATMVRATRAHDVVLSDCRFPNEAQAIRNAGGKVIRLIGRGDAGDAHASEVPLPAHLVDHHIHNGGGHEDLYASLDHLVHHIAGC